MLIVSADPAEPDIVENALTTQIRPPEEIAADDGTDADATPPRRRLRTVLGWTITTLAVVLVLFILLMPVTLERYTPGSFLRIPGEAILGAALALLLPGRPRTVVAALTGVALGLVVILKVVDLGFRETLARPFDPVLDWTFVRAGVEFVTSTFGKAGAAGVLIALTALVIALMAATTFSVLRLTRLLVRHARAATAGVAVTWIAWIACAGIGAQLLPGTSFTSMGTARLVYRELRQVPASLGDDDAFAAEARVDPFRYTPGDRLLNGLRGKDFVLTFIESYGRTVSETPQVRALTENGTRRLRAAGFEARSAFLTSPTAGGGSWLAHSTMLSGLWIDNQQRYRKLVSSDRMTLNRAFQRAGWRSVAVVPGVVRKWNEAKFFGYDKVYTSKGLGYNGPRFGWATMPDQFTLERFQQLEHGKKDQRPLMAEMPLLSSHAPWAPIPRMVGWDALGDGSVFNAIQAEGQSRESVWQDPARVRTEYRRSIEYSLESLISYVEKYGDDDLVLVFLGDHQPLPIATGGDANRDVPITVIAHDKKVLDRFAALRWQEGMLPTDGAPVWRMNTFRDRFLNAFAR